MTNKAKCWECETEYNKDEMNEVEVFGKGDQYICNDCILNFLDI